jgi:hypothetical protein
VENGNFVGGRGRSRSRGPVIVEPLYDETVREEFDYQPRTARNISRGREEYHNGYRLYEEHPSIRHPRSGSRGRLFGEPFYEGPSFRGPSYERPSYEIPSFDGPSFGRPSHERPPYGGDQHQFESEDQVNSQIYESGKRANRHVSHVEC